MATSTIEFETPVLVKCDGSSIWMNSLDLTVRVSKIVITSDHLGVFVNVCHDGPWTIYTDRGFEQEISSLVGFNVHFTEAGMQDVGVASLEAPPTTTKT